MHAVEDPAPSAGLPPPAGAAGRGVDADPGLAGLILIAQFHNIPADAASIRHQAGRPGDALLTTTDFLLAAKPLMEIVPDDTLEVEAKVSNKDIGFVARGKARR